MVDNIERSTLRGEYALAVFLDIAGAFDNLSLPAAVEGMTQAKLPANIQAWYTDYLMHRVAEADIQGCSKTVLLTQGTPCLLYTSDAADE